MDKYGTRESEMAMHALMKELVKGGAKPSKPKSKTSMTFHLPLKGKLVALQLSFWAFGDAEDDILGYEVFVKKDKKVVAEEGIDDAESFNPREVAKTLLTQLSSARMNASMVDRVAARVIIAIMTGKSQSIWKRFDLL